VALKNVERRNVEGEARADINSLSLWTWRFLGT